MQKRWRNRDNRAPVMSAAPRRESGPARSVQRLLSLVDTADPAWADIAAILRAVSAAGAQLDEETVAAAVRLGRRRFEERAQGAGKAGTAEAAA